MKHIMVDIETFGGGTNGLIVSIGAVGFDPLAGGPQWDGSFHENIRIQSALDHGAVVQGDTLRWWLEQDRMAQAALFKPPPLDESLVLEQFRTWFRAVKCEGIWSHGSNFDLRLLREAYARYGQRPPWHWKEEYDTRTLFDTLWWVRKERPTWPQNPLKHAALQDAIVQAAVVQDALRRLQIPLDRLSRAVVESAPAGGGADGL